MERRLAAILAADVGEPIFQKRTAAMFRTLAAVILMFTVPCAAADIMGQGHGDRLRHAGKPTERASACSAPTHRSPCTAGGKVYRYGWLISSAADGDLQRTGCRPLRADRCSLPCRRARAWRVANAEWLGARCLVSTMSMRSKPHRRPAWESGGASSCRSGTGEECAR